MKTWEFYWALIRYRPWLYGASALLWGANGLTRLLPGLIAREFFDALSGAARAGLNVWTLIALLLLTTAGRIAVVLGGYLTSVVHGFTISGLLRRNLLARVLERPGARAVPGSPGEALSHFRDDARQAEQAIEWTANALAMPFFALAALGVLLATDARITVLVFLPLAGVVATARAAGGRLARHRQASRQATGRVTGAIGEIFGAAAAIQVAGAAPHVVAHFRRLSDERRRLMLRDRLLTQGLDAVFANTVSVGTGLILLLAAGRWAGATSAWATSRSSSPTCPS